MNATLEEITDQALQLPAEERELLIERLVLASGELPPMDPAVEAEALRRLAELEAGTAKPVSHEDVMRRLREKFPRCA